MIPALLNWLGHVMGLDNLSGPFYGFWLGIGSDIGEVTIIGAAASIWWKHTCHVKGCYRIGRHPVHGTLHVVCKKHHPDGEPTHGEILADHAAARTNAGETLTETPAARRARAGYAPDWP